MKKSESILEVSVLSLVLSSISLDKFTMRTTALIAGLGLVATGRGLNVLITVRCTLL